LSEGESLLRLLPDKPQGLQRGLIRRLSTGEPVAPRVDQFVYPFRWTYNVLNAAEYFRQASLLDGVAPDPRMTDA
jgi:hypothetical protein